MILGLSSALPGRTGLAWHLWAHQSCTWPSPTGNKSDLSELREVPLIEAQSLVEHYDILCAIETSAKDSSNVEEAFVRVATELVMRHGGPLLSEKGTDHIQLDSKDIGETWGCGC